jgi:hypothetical protein
MSQALSAQGFGTPNAMSFSGVMGNMVGGISRGATMGMVPGNTNPNNFTPAQIAAQMNMGGPMSVLPYLGKSYVPNLIFPIASVWSMVDGVKAYRSMKKDVRAESPSHFDPSQLAYNKAVQELDAVQQQYRNWAPPSYY